MSTGISYQDACQEMDDFLLAGIASVKVMDIDNKTKGTDDPGVTLKSLLEEPYIVSGPGLRSSEVGKKKVLVRRYDYLVGGQASLGPTAIYDREGLVHITFNGSIFPSSPSDLDQDKYTYSLIEAVTKIYEGRRTPNVWFRNFRANSYELDSVTIPTSDGITLTFKADLSRPNVIGEFVYHQVRGE